VTSPSLRRRYLERFAGQSVPDASERGQTGYSLKRRYLASLLGIHLPPHLPATHGQSDSGVGDKDGDRSHAAGPVGENLMSELRGPDDLEAPVEDVGYTSPVACVAAGITPRQLDYWARTGLVEPSVWSARKSGSEGLYSFRDILALKLIKRLLDTGISLQQIRAAIGFLREQGADDVAQVTLMSDGASVYACTSPDEVVDLLQGGQGVFGIALGRVWQEVEGTLAGLPAEPVEGRDLRNVNSSDSAERREQAEEVLATLPETVLSMSQLPEENREALVILLAELPPTVSSLAELRGVVSAAGAKRNTA
jgi:DNA-binding transcriptional MerR regulator